MLLMLVVGTILTSSSILISTSSASRLSTLNRDVNTHDQAKRSILDDHQIRDFRKGRYWSESINSNNIAFKKISRSTFSEKLSKTANSPLIAQNFTNLNDGDVVVGGDLIQISGRVILTDAFGIQYTPVAQRIHVYFNDYTDPNKEITANDSIINQYFPDGEIYTNGTDTDVPKDGVPDENTLPDNRFFATDAGFFNGSFKFPDQSDWPKFGISPGSDVIIYLRYEKNETLQNRLSAIANLGDITLASVTVKASSTANIKATTTLKGITSNENKVRPGENATGQVQTIDGQNNPLPSVKLQYRLLNATSGQAFTSTQITNTLKMTITVPTQSDTNGLAKIDVNTTLQTLAGTYTLEIIANYTGYTYNGNQYFGVNYDGTSESTNYALIRFNLTIVTNAYDTMDISATILPQASEINETHTKTLTNITVQVSLNSYWNSIGSYRIPNLVVNITITNNSPILQAIVFEDLFGYGATFSPDRKSVQMPTDASGQVKISLNATFPDFFGPGDAIVTFSITVTNPETNKLSPDGSTPQQPHAWIEPSRSLSNPSLKASIHPDYTVVKIVQKTPSPSSSIVLRPGESINVTYQLINQQNGQPFNDTIINTYLRSIPNYQGVSITPYSSTTDTNGEIVVNISTTYGVTPESSFGVNLQFKIVADFENDSINFLIGDQHLSTSNFAEYNKTWSETTTTFTIKAIYNTITINVATNFTSSTPPRPGDAFRVYFTLVNKSGSYVGPDLDLIIETSIVNGSITYTGPTLVKGTFIGGNVYRTSSKQLILEYDSAVGTSKNSVLNITVILTNSTLKNAFPITGRLSRWNVGESLNSTGGNTELTRGSYSNRTLLVKFDPQYRFADITANFLPNPATANTTVILQATLFLLNGGERVPGVKLTLVPDPSIPLTNLTMINTTGVTDANGAVKFAIKTANTSLLYEGTYQFFVIADLENDSTVVATENNPSGRKIRGEFINGTSTNGKLTNKTLVLTVQWVNTATLTINSITDSVHSDAGFNGSHFIAYRQTSNISVTVSYIAQDGSPLANKDITIQLFTKSGTFKVNLTTVTTGSSGSVSTIVTLPTSIEVGAFNLTPQPVGVDNAQLNDYPFIVRSGLNATNIQHQLNGNTVSAYFVGNTLTVSGTIIDEFGQTVNTGNYPSRANNLSGKIKIQLVDGSNLNTALTTKQAATFNAATGQFTLNNIQIPSNFNGATIRINVSIETNPTVDLFQPITITASEIINVYQDIQWSTVRVIFNNGTSQVVSNNSRVILVGYSNRIFQVEVTIQDNHARALTNMKINATWKGTSKINTTDSTSGKATFNDQTFLAFSGSNNDSSLLQLHHVLPNNTDLLTSVFTITLELKVFDHTAPEITQINGITNRTFQNLNPTTNLAITATVQDQRSGDEVSTGVAGVTYIFTDANGNTLFTVTNPIQSGNDYKVVITFDNRSLFQNNEEIHLLIKAVDNGNNLKSVLYVFYIDFTPPSRIQLIKLNVTSKGYVLPDTPLGNTFTVNITINDAPSATTLNAISPTKAEGVNGNSIIIILQNGTTTVTLDNTYYSLTILVINQTAISMKITITIDRIKALQSTLNLPDETYWELLINASDDAGNYLTSNLLGANIKFKIDQTAPDLTTLKIDPPTITIQGRDGYSLNNTEDFKLENVTIIDQETDVYRVELVIDLGNDGLLVIPFTKNGTHSWTSSRSFNFSNITQPTDLNAELRFTDYMNNTDTHPLVFRILVEETPPIGTSTLPTSTSPNQQSGNAGQTATLGEIIINFFISVTMIFGSAAAGIITGKLIEIARHRMIVSRNQ